MNVIMIGTGYVGLTTGLGFAALGNKVVCVDTDTDKIASLDLGKAPFYEPGLAESLKAQQEAGNIMFTSDLASVIDKAEVIILAVGTPPKATGEADLQYIFKASEDIGKLLKHEALLAIKSTVPVGTNRKVLAKVREAMKAAGRDDLTGLIQIASVPEFLREGSALKDFFSPDRIVIGADDELSYRTIEQLHNGLTTTIVKTTIESAELIKYASNAFLATKISFINEIANIAERTGADVLEISRAVGLDSRIGPKFLNAGIGFGGSCFPKDVSALKQVAGLRGYDFKLLSAVIEVNNRQRHLFFQKILDELKILKGRRIAVWGLAFKPGTDDVRESAAIEIVQKLYANGAEVIVYDPKASEMAKKLLPDGIVFADNAVDATDGAEALIVLTEWPEFSEVSFPAVKARMIDPIIFDGRNCLRSLQLEKFGFSYIGVGLCDLKKS
jgi:UDPglucose 6-dehydrogenase